MAVSAQAAPRGVGPGRAPWFNCIDCAKPKPMLGRVARRRFGLRTFICAECKKKDPRPRGA